MLATLYDLTIQFRNIPVDFTINNQPLINFHCVVIKLFAVGPAGIVFLFIQSLTIVCASEI